jgi:hypothetical protein
MAWRVARSLDVLLGQINGLAPGRSKISDGSIGDANHQNTNSDHNPWYPRPGGGIVTARDFTHDPARMSCHWLAQRLAEGRDPRIKYIIWNHAIMSGNGGPAPWVWRAYTGANSHTKHLHLSVVASPQCDNPTVWLGFTPEPVKPVVPPEEEDDVALIIAKNVNGPDHWVSDLKERRWIQDEAELEGVLYWMDQLGHDTQIHEFENMDVLGVPNATQRYLPGYPLTDYPFDPPEPPDNA